ncbi:hypothetical protein [Bryobacter aggregatus]|uniref:hypothetical protein n=1 Tax=Bryobacter aggregatus TaxID=360054 RepID=UPI0012BAC0BE|nr:hypothetical protein [Bryobacter aggregatus]
MAKLKPSRGGLKKAEPEKITPKSFVRAIPCLFILLIAVGLMSLLFYATLTGVKK